jgi:hypothetical protein
MKILPQNPSRRPPISIASDFRGLVAAATWMAPVVNASTPGLSPETLEFFESKIRPVLATECYECHGAEKQKGGLRLDYKAGWEKGGDSGPSILPGNPKDSLLLQSVRHEDVDLKMPSKAPKLSPEAIAHLEKWVAMGAPDPREKPEPATNSTWLLKLAERRKWWSFQPVQNPAPPVPQNVSWSSHPVDQFLLHAMEKKGLSPAAEVSPGILLRRLRFVLTGLSPNGRDLREFEESVVRLGIQQATEQMVDRLLALPAFGERWARHWMDLVRYAESHGSEGDPALPEAWHYRDYLIRAWNNDLPLDQLLREHLAGDLLANPRIHSGPTSKVAWNESAIGTAHLRMVEHGYQPVDTLDQTPSLPPPKTALQPFPVTQPKTNLLAIQSPSNPLAKSNKPFVYENSPQTFIFQPHECGPFLAADLIGKPGRRRRRVF